MLGWSQNTSLNLVSISRHYYDILDLYQMIPAKPDRLKSLWTKHFHHFFVWNFPYKKAFNIRCFFTQSGYNILIENLGFLIV